MSKKLLTFVMILMALFAFTLVGCSTKDEPAVEDEVVLEEDADLEGEETGDLEEEADEE